MCKSLRNSGPSCGRIFKLLQHLAKIKIWPVSRIGWSQDNCPLIAVYEGRPPGVTSTGGIIVFQGQYTTRWQKQIYCCSRRIRKSHTSFITSKDKNSPAEIASHHHSRVTHVCTRTHAHMHRHCRQWSKMLPKIMHWDLKIYHFRKNPATTNLSHMLRFSLLVCSVWKCARPCAWQWMYTCMPECVQEKQFVHIL